MIVKKIIAFFVLILVLSCQSNNTSFLIAQPTDKELNNAVFTVKVDENEVYSGSLEYTNIASIYKEILVDVEKGEHQLKIKLNDDIFEFSFEYPKDKYIILSPNYIKDKTSVGILKSNEKFNLH